MRIIAWKIGKNERSYRTGIFKGWHHRADNSQFSFTIEVDNGKMLSMELDQAEIKKLTDMLKEYGIIK